jgi:DNA polymerase-3 subunit gamma/tau
MAYQVLARKYRPQRFSDVAGQDHVTRTLMNALSQGRIAHGYIFSGHRGIGKTTIARILAMALNCQTAIGTAGRATPEPCGLCDSCTEIRGGNAVDVIEIDAATNRGIDEIRELRDAARYRPARDRYKIYILDEAHQITDAAFNALLKTLEEPPDHVVFMMATTQPEDIPQTIRSRCQHFSFHAVKFDDILAQLRSIAIEEQVGADDEALALLAEAGDGSMRDALSIMDQAIASAPLEDGRVRLDAGQIRELMGSVRNTVFERLLEAISENQSGPVVAEINRLLNAGNSASQLARQFVRYLRNVLMARIAGENSELLQLSPDERARTGRSALLFSEEDLTRFLQVMLRTFDELNYRQEPRFHLELGLLKLVHLQRLLPVEQLLSQLGSGAPAPKLGGGPLPGRAPAEGGMRAAGASPRVAPSVSPNGPARTAPLGSPQGFEGSRPAAEPARPPAGSPSGSAAGSQAPPAFSPFEQDTRRKGGDLPSRSDHGPIASVAPAAEIEQAAVGVLEIDEAAPEASSPASTAPSTPAVTSVAPPPEKEPVVVAAPAPVFTPEPPAAPAAVAWPEPGLEPRSQPVPPPFAPPVSESGQAFPVEIPADQAGLLAAPAAEAATKPSPATGDPASGDLDTIREQVAAALEQAGHNTAAALLQNGTWDDEGENIRVELAAKKTMLGLTMNAEAEKICREAMRVLAGDAKPKTLTFVPGEGTARGPAAGRAAAKPPATGSIQAQALDNPLVKQAQELFRAEVRSVVDLRNK